MALTLFWLPTSPTWNDSIHITKFSFIYPGFWMQFHIRRAHLHSFVCCLNLKPNTNGRDKIFRIFGGKTFDNHNNNNTTPTTTINDNNDQYIKRSIRCMWSLFNDIFLFRRFNFGYFWKSWNKEEGLKNDTPNTILTRSKNKIPTRIKKEEESRKRKKKKEEKKRPKQIS